jgi:hypothetical protein
MQERLSLEQMIGITRNFGPRVLYDNFRTRLYLDEAEYVAKHLQREGIPVEPYDFPNTAGIWQAKRWTGEFYKHHATRSLLFALGREMQADPTTVPGFGAILHSIRIDTFKYHQLNAWGTTLGGMLHHAYNYQPSRAVMDVIAVDDDFSAIKKTGLSVYDFSMASLHAWNDKSGCPTGLARSATRELVRSYEQELGVDATTVPGFMQLLPLFTQRNFIHRKINRWGTNLSGMLQSAYGGGPGKAVIDLVDHDHSFIAIKNAGLWLYDFPKAPNRFWVGADGRPSQHAREATKHLVRSFAEPMGVDYKTRKGFSSLLPYMTQELFFAYPINVWGTTLTGMLSHAYQGTPALAIKDMVQHDPEFYRLKRRLPLRNIRTSRRRRGVEITTS